MYNLMTLMTVQPMTLIYYNEKLDSSQPDDKVPTTTWALEFYFIIAICTWIVHYTTQHKTNQTTQ